MKLARANPLHCWATWQIWSSFIRELKEETFTYLYVLVWSSHRPQRMEPTIPATTRVRPILPAFSSPPCNTPGQQAVINARTRDTSIPHSFKLSQTFWSRRGWKGATEDELHLCPFGSKPNRPPWTNPIDVRPVTLRARRRTKEIKTLTS